MHPEVIIKVNATVDAGIAPLVLALNQFPGLITVDSCEGDREKAAYVYFKYGGSPRDLAIFCCELARRLSAIVKGSDGYCLRVEWNYDFSANMACLKTKPDCISNLCRR